MRQGARDDRLGKLKMDEIDVDDALRGALQVPPPGEPKPKKKRKAEKKVKKGKK